MRYFDVFNGDADGLCALQQLRLADPVDSELVTGLKSEIALLDRVPASPGDIVTVLDGSLEHNRAPLAGLLDRGAVVRYFDHHFSDPIPTHRNLEVILDVDGASCTSALMDSYLSGIHRPWAVVGAYGEGLHELATVLAADLGLSPEELASLQELGEALEYNAHCTEDLDAIMPPADVYRAIHRYVDPLDVIRDEPLIARLSLERKADLDRALAKKPIASLDAFDAFLLPDEAWSRRVAGCFANRLALADPVRSHVVLTPTGEGYVVSVRSPEGSLPAGLPPFLDSIGIEKWKLH